MKKYLLILVFTLIVGVVTGQQNERVLNDGNAALFDAANAGSSSFGSSVTFYNQKRLTDGTFYLFDDWNNYTIIQTQDNQKFVLRNINLNMERHTFESKVEGDSIFTFGFNNIDKFIINGRTYKNYYWAEDSKVYEVIYDNNDFQLLKGFRVQLIEGSANPMLNRSRDKYVRKEYYCIRKDNKIKTIKLKKSRILKLVDGDVEKANKIVAYARNNSLSFKKERDVQKILEFSAKN